MGKLAKHLIVISYDAFSEDNWEMAKNLPNLSKLIKSGSYSTKLKSVYPTLTYVVHTSLVTGVYPDKHGIIHNNPFQPFIEEKNQKWYWFRKDIKAPTIYDALKNNNMSSAGILWPVTGKSSIRYNLPEIVAINGENQALKVLKNGSPFFCLNMELKYGKIRKGVRQPYLDNFSTMCAIDTIKRKKPNLLLLHLIDLDDAKHKYGTDSSEVEEAIKRMDKRLGQIINAVEEAGMWEDAVFIVVGDHGQFNVRYKVHLNNILKEENLIFEDNGSLQWRAYFQSCGGSAYLHIRKDDKEAEKSVLEVLKKIMEKDQYGIDALYYREELNSLHIDKTIQYMVEAKQGYSFDDNLHKTTIEDLEEESMKYATHGYLPDKDNYRCNLIISGDKIRKEHELGPVEMVDMAPTMAKILGIEFNSCDGRCLDEIFLG